MERARLFVYGTLQRGQPNHAELAGAHFLAAVRTAPRHAVVEREGYPALVSGKVAVEGELYELDVALFSRLDAFEGSGYVRALVELDDGGSAFAYFSASARPATRP